MKVPHQLRQLRGRLRGSDHSSRVDDGEIALKPGTPEFPDQAQRTNEHTGRRGLPERNAEALQSSRSRATSFCDQRRCQGAIPFDRDSAANHKSLCASTTLPRRAEVIHREEARSTTPHSSRQKCGQAGFPDLLRENRPDGRFKQHRHRSGPSDQPIWHRAPAAGW
jgi:hypothetical protein